MLESTFRILKLGYVVNCFSVTDKKKLHGQNTLFILERGKSFQTDRCHHSQIAQRLAVRCMVTK